ncbi:PREDICTED: centrosomal protein of 135 kDa [Ceratosolen solmsi marchali]|uniref:Centrosomal protein of 135 kDa n=1 Tax=Ceratosolen solmsi marchali TaxID=326594 RepID=A0AAJ6VN92_9HYME|nr:PREDICTED: centrosomal protein of 135 kDa [Ceratosolen solmsi marchali]
MSNDCNNYSIAGRYRTVRKNLDALGYKQALSLDSLPLIELLLVDLAQAKETLKHFQSIAKDNLEACSQLQLVVDPYKCDNAKLVQECNQIHQELIEANETSQKQNNDYKKRIRKLESELSDQQLSFSKNLQRIKQLEIESSNKSKKILELQGKCCKPIVNNINLATKKRSCYPLRRPILEAESFPKSISTSTTNFSSKSVEPCVIDFVSMADHRISCLSNEITKLKEELFINNEHIESLKLQLNTKNKEVSRLKKMLEGGRPCASINKDHCCVRPELLNEYKRNANCDDFLNVQQSKLNMEQQLKEALNKQHDAMAQAMKLAERNKELENELKSVDRMTLAVEADCNSTVKENNKRVFRLQEKLEDLMTQVHVLENELIIQRREAQELRADLEASRLEKSNIQRVLESTLEEKKQMMNRINTLTVMASNSPDKIAIQEKRSDLRKTSASKKCSCQKDVIDEAPQCNIDKLIHDKDVIIESLQNTIERIENEREHYKSEYIKIKDQCKKDTEKDNENMWSQICELRVQISEKDHTISKLLREKKELCQEKFNLENKLHNYQNKQERSSSPCNYCRSSLSSLSERKSIGTSNKTERVERERDVAFADAARLIEERDALRERLKLATEAHATEQRRLRENLDDTQSRLAQIEQKWRELLLVQGTRRATINGLDDQLNDLKEDLRRTKQELTEQRTQYFQLRTLQDQTDQALGDVQGQLAQSENELSGALDRYKNLERQQLQFDNQIKELRQEINTHRSKVAQLDHEKDQLLMDLDEKTEKIAALERELDFKEQQANGMEQQLRDLSCTKE